MTRRLVAMACAIFFTQASLGADCPTTLPSNDALVAQGLLDPDTSNAKHQELGHLLLCSAIAGDAISMDIAGSLYRWGPRHPAHVFPEDHDKARDLFNGAAAHGRKTAMLKLAELELADGNAHEAMIWIQLETAFYQRDSKKRSDGGDTNSGGGYYTMLLKRISDALGPYDANKLLNEVNARFAALDKQIATAPKRAPDQPPLGRTHRPAMAHIGQRTNDERRDGAYAQVYVEVDPRGVISRRWLVDSYPEPSTGMRLGRALEQFSWDPLPAGQTTLRYAMFPLWMGSLDPNVRMKSP